MLILVEVYISFLLYQINPDLMEAKKDNDNTDFNMSLDQWLSSVEVVDTNTIKGVLAVAIGLFPRKVQE